METVETLEDGNRDKEQEEVMEEKDESWKEEGGQT